MDVSTPDFKVFVAMVFRQGYPNNDIYSDQICSSRPQTPTIILKGKRQALPPVFQAFLWKSVQNIKQKEQNKK